MAIKLYDSLSNRKKSLPGSDPVTFYSCGPTVYLEPHIGNWRTFIFYDTLVRVLKLTSHDVTHVLNITDVGHLVSDGDTGQDKLAKTAKLQRKTAWEIAQQYTEQFLSGMKQLNILTPTKLPKATDHIPEQIYMIEEIEKKGFTYKIDDGIYFDTSKVEDYGKLNGGKIEIDEEFARINKNDKKRNPQDFALWKFSPADEKRDMEWDSPWGVGFPGWHLECSAMANKYLGKTIDIHAGGIDHIPIHHTNEIAQSETANGVEFAKIWMHAEFMKVDGQRMGKSLGNFFTLDDIIKKGFSALDFRMMIVQSHYKTESNFSWDNLNSAANRLKNLRNLAELRWQLSDGKNDSENYVVLKAEFVNALEDDLNTPKALQILSGAVTIAKTGISKESAQAFIELLQTADKALGLQLLFSTPDINDELKGLIQARDQARQNKDYTKSDDLRSQLEKSHILVLDDPQGQIWQRN